MKKNKEVEVEESNLSFSYDQLVNSKRYRLIPDVIRTVLEPGESYTFKQVEARIEAFKKRK